MALIRWEPARELSSMQSEMNRLFGTIFDTPTLRNGRHASLRSWIPAMDVTENDSEYILKADLPGLSDGDVNVELDDNVLRISGERKSEHEESKAGYHRVERAFGRFSRSLRLPEGVTAEGVQANFDNGVLEVHIQKPEQRKPQKVEISVGREAKTIEGGEDTESPQAA
ncbi:MAG TPA: Hsp20/alpha crystallin family protein [Solirubrobacteraceae bacterium]|nr:Hsp20/alpha crystallin family protein [Solirubrobacteraceae bacterium]